MNIVQKSILKILLFTIIEEKYLKEKGKVLKN